MTTSDRAAVLAAQLSATLIRKLGLGMGSNLPGRIARKISASVLGNLAAQTTRGVIAVTGTNGKSTTSGILASILRVAGFSYVHNKQGANLVTGITASLVESADWQKGIDADLCLFEIDEAALPVVAKEMNIGTVVVTNLFRDQLDRFGELDTTARLISAGIGINKSMAILNADDPNVSQLSPDVPHVFYGIESVITSQAVQKNMELAYCSKCGKEISYRLIFYGQLGHWFCESCGHERPAPSICAADIEVKATSSRFKLRVGGSEELCMLNLPGLFNVYNAVAAAAAAHHLGVSLEAIRFGIKEYSTLFGRSEKLKVEGKDVIVQLIKNPAGATQAVASCLLDENAAMLIAINDNLADGRDVSWLWDADFEQLASVDRQFVVSGQRAEDMAVRLKYAGVDPGRIIVDSRLAEALRHALNDLKPGQTLWIMPTYTNLLDLQRILKGMGCIMSGTGV